MSVGIFKPMLAQNAIVLDKIRFVPHFISLRMGWTANELKAEGMEKFVEEYLPVIRKNNPQVRYDLRRVHVPCDSFLVGEWKYVRTRGQRVDWKNAEQLLSIVEMWSLGGDFRKGREQCVPTRLPRGLELWSTETMGHDVYQVHSKWKTDKPSDYLPSVRRGQPQTSEEHPYYVRRRRG